MVSLTISHSLPLSLTFHLPFSAFLCLDILSFFARMVVSLPYPKRLTYYTSFALCACAFGRSNPIVFVPLHRLLSDCSFCNLVLSQSCTYHTFT